MRSQPAGDGDREPLTTSGTIAVVNLDTQIDGLAARSLRTAGGPAANWLALIDLLTLRGQVLGRIADYERAAELAERLVRGDGAGGIEGGSDAAGGDGAALLARARTRATSHRFADALADLDAAAERGGADRAALAASRRLARWQCSTPSAATSPRQSACSPKRGSATIAPRPSPWRRSTSGAA
jgi:hypothetical protein